VRRKLSKRISSLNRPRLKKYGLVTVDFLETIYYFTEQFVNAFDRKSLYQKLNSMDYGNPQIFNNLRSLIDRGYLEPSIMVNGSSSIKLTNKGKLKILEHSTNIDIDGRWRFISFDIPETMCKQRRQFRNTIKRIGFRQVQKSLWASPFVKADQVNLAIEEFGLNGYVAYFIVEKTDIDNHLKKLFQDLL
jgi:DNA-binding transcriptional regulator PaaX